MGERPPAAGSAFVLSAVSLVALVAVYGAYPGYRFEAMVILVDRVTLIAGRVMPGSWFARAEVGSAARRHDGRCRDPVIPGVCRHLGRLARPRLEQRHRGPNHR